MVTVLCVPGTGPAPGAGRRVWPPVPWSAGLCTPGWALESRWQVFKRGFLGHFVNTAEPNIEVHFPAPCPDSTSFFMLMVTVLSGTQTHRCLRMFLGVSCETETIVVTRSPDPVSSCHLITAAASYLVALHPVLLPCLTRTPASDPSKRTSEHPCFLADSIPLLTSLALP